MAASSPPPTHPRARWGWRDRLRQRLSRRRLPLFYSRGYSFALPANPLDPLRGERILTALAHCRLLAPQGVTAPQPAPLRQLLAVHDSTYLESFADNAPIVRAFGVPVSDEQRERALMVQRTMTGGTVAATRRAIATGGVVGNLGGGFHHAHRDRAQGFCLFNDVAIAIAAVRLEGFAGPIAVVDLDLHDGDGTRAIFRDDPTVFTYSLHNRHWDEPEATASLARELGSRVDDASYLGAIRETLPAVLAAHRPELVIYLAGADPAADDALGDWKISAEAMLARDRLVHELCRHPVDRSPVPLVVLLAGGYGEHAWRYSARFLGCLLAGGRRVPELPDDQEVLMLRYRALSRLLDPAELSGAPAADDDWGLTEEDLLGARREGQGGRLLGFYTPHGIELVLERSGVLDRLRDLGYGHPELEVDLSHPGGHTLRVWGGPERRELLIEARLQRDRRTLPGCELLTVEWLLLQDPRARFTPERPPLPGQRHPGLGVVRDAVALLVQVCHRLHLDGLSFTPANYHTAALGSRYVRFLDPLAAATFDALSAALAGIPLAQATRLVHEGKVIDEATGKPFHWQPMPMVLVVSEGLAHWFAENQYEERRAAARQRLAFRVAAGG